MSNSDGDSLPDSDSPLENRDETIPDSDSRGESSSDSRGESSADSSTKNQDDVIPAEETLHRVEYTHGPEKADEQEMNLLHLSFLFDKKSRVHIIDWLLTDAPEGQYLSKSEMARRADVGRNSVGRHIDVLVDFGLVDVQGEKSPRYAPAVESDSYEALRQTNLVLERVYRERTMARN